MTTHELLWFAFGVASAAPAAWSCARLQLARHAERLADAERDDVILKYPHTRDGRDARNYAPGRYDEEVKAA